MNSTVSMQLYSLLIFTISGIAIGIFFDIFRILRKSFKTPDVVTYIEDTIFWIFSGLFFLFILFKFNNGEIRSYVILGLIFGITIYIFTISKYFIKMSVSIICFIKKIILYPLQLLWKFVKKLIKPFSFIVINLRKNMINIYNKILKTTKKIKKIKHFSYGKKDF